MIMHCRTIVNWQPQPNSPIGKPFRLNDLIRQLAFAATCVEFLLSHKRFDHPAVYERATAVGSSCKAEVPPFGRKRVTNQLLEIPRIPSDSNLVIGTRGSVACVWRNVVVVKVQRGPRQATISRDIKDKAVIELVLEFAFIV